MRVEGYRSKLLTALQIEWRFLRDEILAIRVAISTVKRIGISYIPSNHASSVASIKVSPIVIRQFTIDGKIYYSVAQMARVVMRSQGWGEDFSYAKRRLLKNVSRDDIREVQEGNYPRVVSEEAAKVLAQDYPELDEHLTGGQKPDWWQL